MASNQTPDEVRAFLAAAGRKGGASRSTRKQEAARRNGKMWAARAKQLRDLQPNCGCVLPPSAVRYVPQMETRPADHEQVETRQAGPAIIAGQPKGDQ